MKEIGYDSSKMPLGKLGKQTLNDGYKILKDIEAVLKRKTIDRNSLTDLSSKFYSLIPHDFGFQKMANFIKAENPNVKQEDIDARMENIFNMYELSTETTEAMNKEVMPKLTFKNKDTFEKEILGYKSYQKYVIPAATEEGPGTLELDIKDVVVVAEKDAVHYFKEVFSKEGVTVEVEEQSSDKENKENAVVDPQGEKTEENVTPAKAKKSAKKSTGTEPEVESSEPVVEGTI